MIEVDEAVRLVLQQASALPVQRVAVADALGCTLAEDVASDVDSPPHDKSLMDGYAVRWDDLQQGRTVLQVIEEVTAGDLPKRALEPGQATRIMTGAPIPAGADAVVIIEQTVMKTAHQVQLKQIPRGRGDNIMAQGQSMRQGEVVLTSGQRLGPMDIGLLSEVGRHRVAVYDRPTVAVIATGNELVPADQQPGPGQIRNSNEPMLAAQVRQAGGTAIRLGIVRDDRDRLRTTLQAALQHDVVVLSGGVSAGVLDLVPGVLQELGVEQVFHKVHLKPGKPIWFGCRNQDERRQLVFGLPGNPVSSLVCFELFVRTAIRRLMGVDDAAPRMSSAYLASAHRHRGERPTYHPAQLTYQGPKPCVTPIAWRGSADLRSLAAANCLCYFPAGQTDFTVGQPIEVYRLRED